MPKPATPVLVAAVFMSFVASSGGAQTFAAQCIAQFVATCGAAMADPDPFLEDFAAREAAHVYTTPDMSTRVATVTSATDLGDGAGIWERIVFTDLGDARLASCAFDCSMEDDVDPSALRDDLLTGLTEIAPDATVVGGPYGNADGRDISLDWWGSQVFHVSGWANAPVPPAQITLHCCGLVIDTMAEMEPGQ